MGGHGDTNGAVGTPGWLWGFCWLGVGTAGLAQGQLCERRRWAVPAVRTAGCNGVGPTRRAALLSDPNTQGRAVWLWSDNAVQASVQCLEPP